MSSVKITKATSPQQTHDILQVYVFHVLARISPVLRSSILSLSELDKSSVHQKHGTFILTAVFIILIVVKQELC